MMESVQKIVAILELLSLHQELGLTGVAERLGLNKATTYRILQSLRQVGYVSQRGNAGPYYLTIRMFEIGSRVLDWNSEVKAARPVLERLAEETLETVHLGFLDGTRVVYLDKIDSHHILRMHSRIGNQSPAYCTGLGKVLLSGLSPQQVRDLYREEPLERHTPNTITDIEALLEELQRVRDRGYAIDGEEHEIGIKCIAAPVRSASGAITAAISLSIPKARFPEKRLSEYTEMVIAMANETSGRLGALPRQRYAGTAV